MLVVGCDFAVKFLIFVRPQNLSKCGVILLQALSGGSVVNIVSCHHDLTRLPELFPFNFSIGGSTFRRDLRFEVQRQSGRLEIVNRSSQRFEVIL